MSQPPFLSLGDGFSDSVQPASFPKLVERFWNEGWARRVGLGGLKSEQRAAHFGRFEPLAQNIPSPQALRYHGHQFRHYNPDLGDGRGFLYAQLKDAQDGRWLDLGTKGSGTTPYSRTADGRLTLKGAVREALATEMLESLGVNTSKTFCFFETGEALIRNDEPSPTRSAVLTRLSHSHLRIGSFQRLAFYSDRARLQKLVDHTLHFHFGSDLAEGSSEERVESFLAEASTRVGRMCAEWMLAGFVHGVLNTDNINVTGESFDYGPWRFLPTYKADFTAAYFDHSGLYSFGRQPEAVGWALEQLAGALTLIAPVGRLERALEGLSRGFNTRSRELILKRFGIRSAEGEPSDQDRRAEDILNTTFSFLLKSQVPFERFFYDWYGGPESARSADVMQARAAYRGDEFEAWRKALAGHQPLRSDLLRSSGLPVAEEVAFTSMVIDEVERVWAAISDRDDWEPLSKKIEAVRKLGQWYGFRPNSLS